MEVAHSNHQAIDSTQGLKFRKYRPIFRRYFVCRLTSTRYIPLIYRSTEISKFFCIYRRYFADISVFYRFFGIFPDISVLFTASALFMNSTFRATVHLFHKNCCLGGLNPAQNWGFPTSHPLGQVHPYNMICKSLIYCLSNL